MEEITIPATSTPPPPVGEEPVRTSKLDEIARVAFRGVKTLNRIQSIVFDAAYNTSENLLISAPTGAGKTNIAMLTVLREIRRNMEEGVIQKDKFKVQILIILCNFSCAQCHLSIKGGGVNVLFYSASLLLQRGD
jgi:activating signal cointegrator complex subunit 3